MCACVSLLRTWCKLGGGESGEGNDGENKGEISGSRCSFSTIIKN